VRPIRARDRILSAVSWTLLRIPHETYANGHDADDQRKDVGEHVEGVGDKCRGVGRVANDQLNKEERRCQRERDVEPPAASPPAFRHDVLPLSSVSWMNENECVVWCGVSTTALFLQYFTW
jgi:hypothetical protein